MSNSPGESNTVKLWQLFLPNLGGWIFLLLLAGFLFFRSNLLLMDGGSCRHFLNGVYLLQHHHVPFVNYFSALFPNEPIVNRCWLGDFAFGSLYHFFNLNGVVFLSTLAIALSLTWAYQIGRARGAGTISGPLLMIPVVAACSLHWSARCHVFSYFPFLLLFQVIFMSTYPTKVRVLLSTSIMLWWTNLHGSFVIGILLLLANLCGHFVESLFFSKKEEPRAYSLKADLLCLIGGAVATFFNFSGSNLHQHLIQYMGNANVPMYDEWRSIDFSLGLPIWSFVFLFIAFVCMWIISRKKTGMGELVFAGIMFAGGVHSMRIIPYFALLALPVIGPVWREMQTRFANLNTAKSSVMENSLLAFQRFEKRYEAPERALSKSAPWNIALAAVMAVLFFSLPAFSIRDFSSDRLPVQSAKYIEEHHINGLGFMRDNWAGYMYWRIGKPIFFDDWPEYYPHIVLEEYMQLITASGKWQDLLDKRNVQYVLVPGDTPLSQELAKLPQWQHESVEKGTELYVRKAAAPVSVQ